MVEKLASMAGLIALILLAGCGGDGEPSREEFAQQVNERTRPVAQLFEQTFGALARASSEGEISDAAKQQIRDLAEAQRRAAREIEALDPPEGAEAATAELVAALGEHAGRLEEAAEREALTFDQLTAATSPPPELARAVGDLRELGIDVVRPLPGG